MGKVFSIGRTHKRIYAFMLVAALVLSLCACGKTETGKNNGGNVGKETAQGNNGGNDVTGSGTTQNGSGNGDKADATGSGNNDKINATDSGNGGNGNGNGGQDGNGQGSNGNIDATDSGNGNGNGNADGNAAQGQQAPDGFKVVIHSATKADFIIEDAYIEPDSEDYIEIVFGKEGEYYHVTKYSYDNNYLGRVKQREKIGLVYEITSTEGVGEYRYVYDGDRLTITVNMAEWNIPFNFYEVEQYEVSKNYVYDEEWHYNTGVFKVADAAAGDGSWLVDMGDGGAPLQIAANLRVEPYSSKLVYFVIDSFDVEPGSKDIYQVVFDLNGHTYCMQAGYGGGEYLDATFRMAKDGDRNNFERVDVYDRTINTHNGGLQVGVRFYNTDIDMDYDSIGEYTLRYFANEGYDGYAEKTYAAADVVSVPLDCLAYEDDGNGGVKITDFNILSNHSYYASVGEEMELVYLPRAIDGKPVTTIEKCPACGYVIVPDSVTRICAGAFVSVNITGLTIPATATDVVIGERDFTFNENIKSLIIRGGNAIIEGSSFYSSGLTYIDIDVKTVGDYAFQSCKSIESLNVVAETIGKGAFHQCNIGRAVILADVIGKAAFGGYDEVNGVSEFILREGIREIGEEAFSYNYGLTSVTIPKSVEKISERAFADCRSLTDVVFQEGLQEIGYGAFSGCENLGNVSLPSTLTVIGGSAFSGCGALTGITIPGSVKTVECWAFYNCRNLTDVVICEGVEVLEYLSFGGCGDLHVSLPDSLRELGVNSFGETVFHYSEDLVATYKGATYTTASYSELYSAVKR